MANPLVAQGTLNRLRASVVWVNYPQLNVTASYLGQNGIRLSLDGVATTFLPTMTGAVTSPEPYMMMSMQIHLLKTQQLADLYKQQMERDAKLGDGTIWPDVTAGGISNYQIINTAIESVTDLSFAGTDASFMVTIRGYYLTNSSLWN